MESIVLSVFQCTLSKYDVCWLIDSQGISESPDSVSTIQSHATTATRGIRCSSTSLCLDCVCAEAIVISVFALNRNYCSLFVVLRHLGETLLIVAFDTYITLSLPRTPTLISSFLTFNPLPSTFHFLLPPTPTNFVFTATKMHNVLSVTLKDAALFTHIHTVQSITYFPNNSIHTHERFHFTRTLARIHTTSTNSQHPHLTRPPILIPYFNSTQKMLLCNIF